MDTGGDLAFLNGVFKVLAAEGWIDRDVRRARHRRLRRGARPRGGAGLGDAGAGERHHRARRWRASRSMLRDARNGDLRLVDGPHPARARRGHHPGPGQRRPRPRLGRAARRSASCRSAGTRACRAGPRSAARPALEEPQQRALRGGVGLPLPDLHGPHRVGDGGRRLPRRASTSSGWWAATSWRRCPIPRAAARALGRVGTRIHQDIVLSSMMLLPPRGHGRPLPGHHALRVAGRRHRDLDRAAHHLLARGARAAGSARRKPEWEVFGEVAARVRPELRGAGALRLLAADPRRDRAARCRSTPASSGCAAQGDQFQWGGPRLFADGRFAHARTARRTSRAVTPPAPQRARRARSTSPPGAASSSTRWCSTTWIP